MVDKLDVTPKSDFKVDPSVTADKKLTAQEYNNLTDKVDEVIDEQVVVDRIAKYSEGYLNHTRYTPKRVIRTGVNLEGLEFGTDVTKRGGVVSVNYFPPSNTVVDYYVSKDIKYFRLPFTWERLQPTLMGELDATYLGYIDNIVTYILSQGGEVILDCHNYAYYEDGVGNYIVGSSEVPVDALTDLWKRIYNHFGNTDRIDYCIMNEPIADGGDALEASTWTGYMQTLVNDLRVYGCPSQLQLSGVAYTGAWSWHTSGNADAYEGFTDPLNNFLIEVHQYNDYNRSGEGDQTVQTPIEPLRNMRLFTDWARKNGFRVHLGETNAPYDDDFGLQSISETLLFMEENSDVWQSVTLWGGGENWSSADKYTLYLKPDHPQFPETPYNLQSMIDYQDTKDVPDDIIFHWDFKRQKYYGFNVLEDSLSIIRNSKGYGRFKDGSYKLFDNNVLRITDKGLLREPTRTQKVRPWNFNQERFYSPDSLSDHFTNYNIDYEMGLNSPDGMFNAFDIVDNATDGEHWFKLKDNSIVQGGYYTASVHAKRSNFDMVDLLLSPDISGESRHVRRFSTPPLDEYGTDWQVLNATMLADDNAFAEYMGIGFAPDDTPAVGHQPDGYVGTGSKISLWHPQLEEGRYATSPIYGVKGSTRQEDNITFTGEALIRGFQENFTFVVELNDLPTVGVDLDILSFDGTPVLKINADSSVETSLGGVLTTDLSPRGNLEGRYKKKIGLSVNRTTGVINLYQQGNIDVVTGTVSVTPTTNVKLEPTGGYISQMYLVGRALNAAELKEYVNPRTSRTVTPPELPFLYATGEGDTSVVVSGDASDNGNFEWFVDDIPATDPASENLVTWSRDLSNSAWTYASGSNGEVSKTQDGTIKSPNGIDDITLWHGRDNIFLQSVPITSSTDYTLSFLAYSNAMQPIIIRQADGTSKRAMLKNGWHRYHYTSNSGANTSLSVRFDTRTASLGGSSLTPDANFRYAVTDIQLEAQTEPTSYIFTEGSTNSRVAGQNSSGQSFYISSADSGKKITVKGTATGKVGTKTFDKKRFAIFIGQSNFIFGAGHDPYRDLVSHYVKVIGRRVDDASGEVTDGQIVPYSNPPHWNGSITANLGDLETMDRGDISLAGFLCDKISTSLGNVEIIAECGNVAGSQFSSEWSTTGSHYLTLKSRIDTFKATYPDAECVGIFYSGMETDIFSSTPYLTHRGVLVNTVSTLRSSYGNCPFVAIGVQDDWGTTGALRDEYMTGFRDISNWLTDAAFVDTSFSDNGGILYTSNNDEGHVSGDITHFSSEAHALLADEMFAKWEQL